MKSITIVIQVVFLTLNTLAQVPGKLITYNYAIPPATYLNPNIDNWVSTSGGAFISDDQDESELPWTSIPQYDAEPSGDLNLGAGCGITDIVDNVPTGEDASYVLFIDPNGIVGDGDEYMAYRLRIAADPGTGNFGFSVLMDIDGLFGTEDPDSIQGNPGFEVEVRVKNGGASKGLYLDDVKGVTSGTNIAVYPLSIFTQKSYGLGAGSCASSVSVFYDFIIPFSDLSTYFGMTMNSSIRLVGATSQNGSTVLGNVASDIAGINDDNYANTVAGQDEAFLYFISNQKPSPVVNATGYGVLPVDMAYFKGVKSELGNTLEWKTLTETNNDYFIIEKSYDGQSFWTTGKVAGNGSSFFATKYNFVDFNEFKKVYYRLKQVDFNGKYEYSKIIVIESNDLEKVQVQYLNNEISLTGEYDWAQLNIQSIDGRQVQITNLAKGSSFSTRGITTGYYIVSFIEGGGNYGSQQIFIP